MRFYFLCFVAAWILGIVVGTSYNNATIVVTGVILLFAVLYLWRREVQYGITILALFAFGWVYSTEVIFQYRECTVTSPVTGEVIRIEKIESKRTQYVVTSTDGCTHLLYADRLPEYQKGDTLEITGDVEQVSAIPQEYAGYARYLQRKNISTVIRYPDSIEVISSSSATYLELVRSAMRQRINQIFSEPEASLALAMVIADRGSLPEYVEDQFRRTGTSHILSISGLHVSMIAAMLVGTLLLFPIHPWARAGIAITVLWLYLFLIGAPVAAVRAVVFWTLVLIALRCQMLVSLSTVFVTTVGAMVSYNPNIVHDIGFQLSFAAVAGIGLMLFVARSMRKLSAPSMVSNMALVSLGAIAATWPISMWHFSSIAFYSVVANIFIVPLSSAFLAVSIASIGLSFIAMPLALLGGFINHVVWLWMNDSARIISLLPGAYREGISIPLWGIVLYYTVFLSALSYVLRFQTRSWREVWQ